MLDPEQKDFLIRQMLAAERIADALEFIAQTQGYRGRGTAPAPAHAPEPPRPSDIAYPRAPAPSNPAQYFPPGYAPEQHRGIGSQPVGSSSGLAEQIPPGTSRMTSQRVPDNPPVPIGIPAHEIPGVGTVGGLPGQGRIPQPLPAGFGAVAPSGDPSNRNGQGENQ